MRIVSMAQCTYTYINAQCGMILLDDGGRVTEHTYYTSATASRAHYGATATCMRARARKSIRLYCVYNLICACRFLLAKARVLLFVSLSLMNQHGSSRLFL